MNDASADEALKTTSHHKLWAPGISGPDAKYASRATPAVSSGTLLPDWTAVVYYVYTLFDHASNIYMYVFIYLLLIYLFIYVCVFFYDLFCAALVISVRYIYHAFGPTSLNMTGKTDMGTAALRGAVKGDHTFAETLTLLFGEPPSLLLIICASCKIIQLQTLK